MNEAGDPPFRPPGERRGWQAIVWIAATLAIVAALVFAWQPTSGPQGAAVLAMPSLPSLPDPAAATPDAAHEDANGGLPPMAASGTELIEVCGVGWVPPDASGAADRAAVGSDRDVLASERALLEALRRKDGDVGEAMATTLELQGAGREYASVTPLQALVACGTPASPSSPESLCAQHDEDRQRAVTLIERLARLATASNDPRVYALAMHQCQAAKGQGSCSLLNVDQWARVDDGNALPWLYVLQRARDRNDPAQIDDALYHVGAATRFENASYALAGRVADRAGASDVDLIAAQLVAVDALAASSRVEPYAALLGACGKPSLADVNRRQACERAAQTLAGESDSLAAVLIGAELGRRLGWPADRVDALRALAKAAQAMDESTSTATALNELPSSCASARRILAAFSRKAQAGEVPAIRAWLASRGAVAAPVASPPAQTASSGSDDAVDDAAAAPVSSASTAVMAAPRALQSAELAASSAPFATSADAAASATQYSATPPPDR
ncbi:MAG: hypothetical protein JO090_09120 [Rhizobacter sp.]|nr:hypothetical protein [Rhizobacter sp.]